MTSYNYEMTPGDGFLSNPCNTGQLTITLEVMQGGGDVDEI